jgi:NDP-4-keto-2,6-dideoxyhexose 3-C-methyltransferase
LHSSQAYKEFTKRVNKIRDQVRNFLQQETAKGKVVYIYGASTKGNVLLQYFDLDTKLLKAATDKNPDKWGKKTVGTLIPIVSIDQYRRDKPDYLLVLPWHFDKEIPEQEREFLKAGGKMIFPLPEFKIVSYQDVAVVR